MNDGQPPSIGNLLAAERARPRAPADTKAAAAKGLALLLGPTAGLGHASPVARPLGSGAAAATAATAARGVGLAKLAAAFVLGGVVTAGVLEVVRPEPRSAPMLETRPETSAAPREPSPAPVPSAKRVAPVASAPPPAPPPLAASTVASSAPAAPVAHATPRPSSSGPVGTQDVGLAAERVLVERARSALARGDGEQALAAADQHAEKFPRGQLAEEREALAIQALVAVGRGHEAAERAGRFRLAYPHSVLLPVVDEALR